MVRSLVATLVTFAVAEDGSLMQFEKASDLEYGQAHGASRTSRMQQNTQAMEDEWKGLLQKIAKSGSWKDPATGNPWVPNKEEVLKPVQDVIGDMEDQLGQQRDLNSEIMGNHSEAIRSCIATRDAAFSNDVKPLKTTAQGSRRTHNACRKAEDGLISTMEADCATFEGLGKCGHEQDWFAAYSEKATGAGTLDEVVEAAVTCKGDIAATTTKGNSCDTAQTTFSGDYCSYATLTRETCKKYADCYSLQTGNWDLAEGSISKLEEEQKIIYRMLGRIRCFLTLLFDKADGAVPTEKDITDCQAAKVTDTPLNVDYDKKDTTPYDCGSNPHPAVADETEAFTDGYGPGDSNWYNAEFVNTGLDAHKKLNEHVDGDGC